MASSSKFLSNENQNNRELRKVAPDEESLFKLREVYKIGGAKACEEYIVKKLEELPAAEVKIGVIGRVNSGKSSLVNSILGLTAKDRGAAKVGCGPTTSEISIYSHPINKQIKFYDIPGMSTMNFPKISYLEKINFEQYDVCIIVTNSFLTEDDIFVIKKLKQANKKYIYVRTCIAKDIKLEKEDNGINDDKLIFENIRNEILQLIPKEVLSELYLIDSRCPELYDLPLLKSKIFNLYDAKKQQVLLYSLKFSDFKYLEEKILMFQQRIFWASALIGTCGIVGIYITKIQIRIVRENSKLFLEELGLTKEALSILAESTKTPLDYLQKIVSPEDNPSLIYGYANDDDEFLKTMINNLNRASFLNLDSWTINIPIYATFKGAQLTNQILHSILSIMEKCARDVINCVEITVANKPHNVGL